MCLTVAVYYLARPFPGYEDLRTMEQAETSRVLDRHGNSIGEFYVQNRDAVPLKAISPNVIDALIATEDRRFYDHSGIDYRSLVRVVVMGILGKNGGGGSTITQQLAKNLYPREQTVMYYPVNKTREMVIASRLENMYSKEEILERYLNTVPFGSQLYGIESASRVFFEKHARDLSVAEAATLVGMLKANTTYHPGLHPEASQQRRNVVLKLMHEQGFINADTFSASSYEPVQVSADWRSSPGSYFLTQVQKRLVKFLDAYNLQHGTSLNLKTSGLTIHTTLDQRLQDAAESALSGHMVRLQTSFDKHWEGGFERTYGRLIDAEVLKATRKSGFDPNEKRNMWVYANGTTVKKQWSTRDSVTHYLKLLHAGFMAMDPQSGAIRSWVGGLHHQVFPYDHVEEGTRRQVGSVFKPIVYATALEEGLDPCTYYSSEQVTYQVKEGEWRPRNSDGNYEEDLTMEEALEGSVNTISVKILEEAGIDRVIAQAHRMGISSEIPEVPSIAMGTASISLQEMVAAYAVFANGGLRVKPHFIEKIVDNEGRVLYEADLATVRVLSEKTAREMAYFLQQVVKEGTARSIPNTYQVTNDLGGKTGTTQGNADGWFMSISPSLVTGSWVGATYPSVAFRETRLGQGAATALPITARFYQHINASDKLQAYGKVAFDPLPDELAASLACVPFEEDYNFFQRLFSRKDKKKDTTKTGGFLNKVKSLFKKKDKKGNS